MGRNKKVFLHFDRPVWIDIDRHREILSLIHPEFRAWNGGHPESASGSSIVTLFLSGRGAELNFDQAALNTLAHRFIQAVSSVLPVIARARLLNIIDGTAWVQEAESKGSYGGVMLPGQWPNYDQWISQSSVGGLHWAGSEWDPQWAGFMEGAVATGVAKGQIVARLLQASYAGS